MKTIIAAVGVSLLLPGVVSAADFKMPTTKYRMETCMQQVFKKYPGKVIRVELIVEIEEEVQATETRFSALASVREDEARRTAVNKFPGEITAVEYELEPNGSASYEFAIRQEDGTFHKVEVDAKSGEIVEAHSRVYEIGTE
jgi:uncharacterized membrane protein YkoI